MCKFVLPSTTEKVIAGAAAAGPSAAVMQIDVTAPSALAVLGPRYTALSPFGLAALRALVAPVEPRGPH